MKRRIVFLCAALFIVAGFKVSGYDNMIIHPRFARLATEVYNQTAKEPLTSEQMSWIVAGAVKEDADPRYFHHFYDYRTGAGYGVWSNAANWTQKQDSQLGDFSESAILAAYRDGKEQLAYIGVGHQVHLIEDMAVPAHTRNDPHNPDPYEEWCQKNSPDIPQPNLIKVSGLSAAIIELAGYTGNNFFSKDAVKIYEVSDRVIKFDDGEYYLVNSAGTKALWAKPIIGGYQYSFTDELRNDYFTQLAPKAVGYSAGVIDYFQKKFAEIDEEKKKENKMVAFLNSISNFILDPFAGVDIMWGDTIATANLMIQLKSNQAVKNEFANNPQLAQDLLMVSAPSEAQISASLEKVINKTTSTIKKTMDKTKVLGEKITAPAPASQELKIATAPKPTPTASKKITINLIPPANAADSLINPALGAPVRTAPIPTSGGIAVIDENINNNLPVNSTPIIIPEPIIYPETNIIASPLSLASSSEAVFLFASDLASSTFEYLLDDISTSSVWQPASTTLTLGNLPDGNHQLRVRAVYLDVADQTPAEFSWTIDTSAPSSQLSALDNAYNQSVFPLSWTRTDSGGDEISYNLDYMINGGAWQVWIIATSATDTIFNQPLQIGDTAGFRLSACDSLGSCETRSDAPQAITQILPDHLVISAVQTSGLTAKDEWVELYNPTATDISLADYKLKKKTATGNETYLVSSFGTGTIKAHGYYLIAHPTEYANAELVDIYYSGASYAVSDDNTILLYGADTVIDKLGFGTATDTETISAINLTSLQKLVRKSTYVGYAPWQGNGLDTNNNRSDFTIVDNYAPHSTDAVTEPRPEAPTLPGATNLEFASSDTMSATLSWPAPENANLGAGVKYEIKYLATTGACTLNKNWRSLPSATDTPEPSLTSGATEQFTLNDLAPGTTYCVAMRTFNGVGWSTISNQLTFRTACNDIAPRAVNYTTHLSRASTSTVPDQIPEHILVVDYIFSMANGTYDLYGGSTCNRIGQYVPAFHDPASSLTRVEFVYDPETKLFTGKYRRCENGWHYNVTVPEGDHCRDHATAWARSRWNTLPSLAGQSVISLKRLTTGEFTAWLRP